MEVKEKKEKKWTSLRVRLEVPATIIAVNKQRIALGLPRLTQGQMIQTLCYEEMNRLSALLDEKISKDEHRIN